MSGKIFKCKTTEKHRCLLCVPIIWQFTDESLCTLYSKRFWSRSIPPCRPNLLGLYLQRCILLWYTTLIILSTNCIVHCFKDLFQFGFWLSSFYDDGSCCNMCTDNTWVANDIFRSKGIYKIIICIWIVSAIQQILKFTETG